MTRASYIFSFAFVRAISFLTKLSKYKIKMLTHPDLLFLEVSSSDLNRIGQPIQLLQIDRQSIYNIITFSAYSRVCNVVYDMFEDIII